MYYALTFVFDAYYKVLARAPWMFAQTHTSTQTQAWAAYVLLSDTIELHYTFALSGVAV